MKPASEIAEENLRTDVLLVDDDRVILLYLSRILEKAHFQVVSAESANAALRQLQRIKPEVIVADVNMPEVNGYEFYQKVREMGHTNVPFIFCSGRDKPSDRILGLRMGADDYLNKPIEPEELVLKVRLQITRTQYTRALKTALERTDSQAVMNGNFGGITVADVIQTAMMLGRGDYCVRLNTSEDSGAIYLTNGMLLHAETGWLAGEKAFGRMLSWDSGTFVIEHKRYEDDPSIVGRIEDHLLDKLTQLDEYRMLKAELTVHGEVFEVVKTAIRPLVNEQWVALLRLVQQQKIFDQILNASPLSDLESVTVMQQLMKEGLIKASIAARTEGA